MRWPSALASTAPSSTAASFGRPSASRTTATHRSIVHCVDHIPARRQWPMRWRYSAAATCGSPMRASIDALDVPATPLMNAVPLSSAIAIERGAYAYNPMVQHQVAQMYLELDAASATVDRYIDDILAGVDHGELAPARLFSAKWRAVEAAKKVVDIALDVAGGAGMFKGNELERLYRDVRCGGFHPGNDALTHEMVGKGVLGIAAELQRW